MAQWVGAGWLSALKASAGAVRVCELPSGWASGGHHLASPQIWTLGLALLGSQGRFSLHLYNLCRSFVELPIRAGHCFQPLGIWEQSLRLQKAYILMQKIDKQVNTFFNSIISERNTCDKKIKPSKGARKWLVWGPRGGLRGRWRWDLIDEIGWELGDLADHSGAKALKQEGGRQARDYRGRESIEEVERLAGVREHRTQRVWN